MFDFDLRAVLENTVELLAPKAHEKDLELVSDMRHEVPALLQGDPGRIRLDSDKRLNPHMR